MAYRCPDRLREKNRLNYIRNRETIIARSNLRNLRVRGAIREVVMSYLASHPCVDCGERDPIVLDFDHIGEKSFGISRARSLSYPVERIVAEMTKCEVRCANCHRRKTYRELCHSSRTLQPEGREPGPKDAPKGVGHG